MFDVSMFDRSADVRGDYPRQINEELAWFVGRYMVRFLRETEPAVELPRVLVGRDGRLSSPALYRSLIEGIASEGGVPIPCGLATTDTICWAVGAGCHDCDAGAIITASHNPPEYNGIKMFRPDRRAGALPGLQAISPKRDLKPVFEEDRTSKPPRAAIVGDGIYPFPNRPVNLSEEFVNWACQWAPGREKFNETIVIDPGNGVGGIFIDSLKKQLPKANIESIFANIDGRFPNRRPNPGLPGATDELGRKVRELKAAFGVAFDGDADRGFLVDEKGTFVPGDHILAAITQTALKKGSGEPVVFVAVCSWLMVETVRRLGGKPIVSKVGQDTVKWVMQQSGANFGGESSAHFNFAGSYYQDSGLIAVMSLWESLHKTRTSLSSVVRALKPWPHSGEINIRIESDKWRSISQQVIEEIRARYKKKSRECYMLPLDGVSVFFPRVTEIRTADELFPKDPDKDPEGARFRYIHPDYSPQWWFNIRRSNNEPLLRVNVECREQSALRDRTCEVVKMARDHCSQVGKCGTDVVDWGQVGPLKCD